MSWKLNGVPNLRAEHLYLTGRYAPGYGDCPLELNDELCLAVDTVRGCGLAITPPALTGPAQKHHRHFRHCRSPVTGTLAGCTTCHLRETCQLPQTGHHLLC